MCGRKTVLPLIADVTAECTEPKGHEGMHYDAAFSRSWYG